MLAPVIIPHYIAGARVSADDARTSVVYNPATGEQTGRLPLATPQDVVRTGRHAEPEWAREAHDPHRDGDAFEWLGFRAAG